MNLRTQLNLGLGIILLAGFGVQWALRSEAIPAIAESQMAARLDQDIDNLRDALRIDSQGAIRMEGENEPAIFWGLFSGHYYRIETPHQTLYSPSLGSSTLPDPRLEDGKPRRWHTTGPAGQPLLMLSRVVTLKDQSVEISVGEDITTLNRHITEIGSLILMLNGVIIFLALILQWIFVRNALKPYVFLKRELETIVALRGIKEPSDADQLVDAKEIGRLVSLIQLRLDRSRNAIGNLAHALKTPLSITMHIAQDAQLSSHHEIQERLSQSCAAMNHIIESELRRARIAGRGPTNHDLDVQKETASLIQVIKTMYASRQLEFRLEVPNANISFDRYDFMELLGNLVDNAAKWCRKEIMVTIRITPDHLSLAVEDDGVGCDRETMQRLTARGARLDEAKGGHGIGLSIVRSLADDYQGELGFSKSDALGGLKVTVRLPMKL